MSLYHILSTHIMLDNFVISWDFLTAGVSVSLILLPALGTLLSYYVALPGLDMRTFPLSYCILFCLVCLSSLGGLLLSEEKMEWG